MIFELLGFVRHRFHVRLGIHSLDLLLTFGSPKESYGQAKSKKEGCCMPDGFNRSISADVLQICQKNKSNLDGSLSCYWRPGV